MNKKQLSAVAFATVIIYTSLTGSADAKSTQHKVKSGETLWSISRTSHVTVAQLKTWNHLKSSNIKVGQKLYVVKPGASNSKGSVKTTTVKTHKVKSGDTLYSIAKKYKTTVNELKQRNKLHSNLIRVGQTLKVMGAAPGQAAPNVGKKSKTNTVHKKKKIVTAVKKSAKVKDKSKKDDKPAMLADGLFPMKKGTYSPFADTWNAERTYKGDRRHEGTDIMAPLKTPIYASTDGVIVRYGWNELGGYRIGINTSEGYNLYYAHMSEYAKGMANGIKVKKGQLIGYVGSTGYGPEGTSGKFAAHLHVGLYDSHWKAMNAYDLLKYWEAK